MPFKPVILLTDALFLLLTLGIIAFVLVVRSRPHLQAPWKKVLQRPTGSVALIVLLCYFLIAIFDSLHFHPLQKDAEVGQDRFSTEVLSVLDVMVRSLDQQQEKTYAAPFATHLYSKETVETSTGERVLVYPRLQYGGSHLQDPQHQRTADIAEKTVAFTVSWLVVWSVGWLIFLWVMNLRSKAHLSLLQNLSAIIRGETDYPWRAIIITTGIISLVVTLLLGLSQYYHVFGTDKIGQDVLYQSIKSIRTGILIGTLTTLVMLPFAILLGVSAGYFRGWIDDIVQYLYTTLNSIPGVLLIAASVLMLQVYMSKHAEDFTNVLVRSDLRLLCLCLILGVTSWTGLCRLLRAETLKLREMEYIQAAHAFGVSKMRIILRHLVPNVMHIVLITIALDFSGLVLAEAVLSYINIGVDPTMNSWGNMINQARLEMAREPVVWWSLVAAFAFMFVLVLFANLFADVVRDALDPRVSERDS